MKTVIIIPTYNEIHNIGTIIERIEEEIAAISYADISILVVDDKSPDGTANVVHKYANQYANIHLIEGEGKSGLGVAYVLGFTHAIEELNADVIFEMDADLSHNPSDIRRLLSEIYYGADFVIGSRYVNGGSIPESWSRLRVANSKWGNIFARKIAGLGNVNDCTGGFRAIRTSLLKKINLQNLGAKGYAFQINLLHQAQKQNAKIVEVPIHFKDREFGESKLQLKDITEFILNCFKLRLSFLEYYNAYLVVTMLIGTPFLVYFYTKSSNPFFLITSFVLSLSLFMSIQGLFNLFLMLYAWEDADKVDHNKSPKEYLPAKNSFTAIVPARHEANVITDTLYAVAKIDYPLHLKEVLVVVRSDDTATIRAVHRAIDVIKLPNIRLITFDDTPINKPHSLNIGLKEAKNEIITVFDAEDQPHSDLYHIVNTVMERDNVSVVQSGVQLMNFRSTWFSAFNVLEYYFWFKSMLHYFASQGIIPLGGNTVFIKKKTLKRVGGWDEDCLTEDADLGFRLSKAGVKMNVVYDERHATREETPDTTISFLKQRTRWNQGFLQIILKGDWTALPLKKRLLAAYILLLPELQACFFLLIPVSLILALSVKLPVIVALISFIPLVVLFLQFIVYNVGMYEFTKQYNFYYPKLFFIKLLLTIMPFQIILGFGALRAITRLLFGNSSWEKTEHINAHREKIDVYTFDNLIKFDL